MNKERYRQLEFGPEGGKLTEQEVAQGWHFCPDWNDMLINVHRSEGDCCTCDKFQEMREDAE